MRNTGDAQAAFSGIINISKTFAPDEADMSRLDFDLLRAREH